MGIYDRKVIAIIGRDIWDHILNNVICGILNTQHMCDIASLVPQPTWRKLSLANALLCLEPNEVFKESLRPESYTATTAEQTGAWLGTGSLCMIIDTPGMNDSQGRDLDHVKHILETLKKGRWVNTFLVVRKGDNLRMDGPFKSMLTMFEMVFGESFWRHVVMSISKTRYIEEETESVQ